MNRPRIATLGIALALASTAAWSAAGDAWYGTHRDFERRVPVEVIAAPADVVVYEERLAPRHVIVPRHVVVEREYVYGPRYVYAPREIVVLRDDRDAVAALNPETGHRIERGLFNRRGPNDFGS